MTSSQMRTDVNNPTSIIAQHRLSYPERLKLVKTRMEKLEHDVQELQQERQADLTIQLHWETRSRIAQALNDIYVRELLQQEEYHNLKSNAYSYLPVVLSSWAVFTKREPATHLIDMGEIDDEAMDMHEGKGAALLRDGLEDSVEFVWGFIPDLERSVMISMFLTRPPNCRWIAHPNPTVGQGKQLINFDLRITQAEKDFITGFIPIAEDKSKRRLFSSD